uniref:Kynurenine formamidase-like n=1 Tax=Phallusia mammillata TaxID=59560 RepID=A0A6F9D6U1_9ASCI|nr:kynurenine formamidase-like [Phallusia mammillata]
MGDICSEMPSYFAKRGITNQEVIQEFLDTSETYSQKARDTCVKYQLDVRYGNEECQIVDIFYPKAYTEETSVVVFFHGGYWQEGSPKMCHYVAIPVTESGKICIFVGKTLAPKSSITNIVDQCKNAMMFIATKFPKAKSLTLSGHSSGGHECAMVASLDWQEIDPNMQKYFEEKLKRVVLLCGVFELTHLIDTETGVPLKLTREEAIKNSPIELVEQMAKNCQTFQTDVILLTAENDAPTIRKWNDSYNKALKAQKVDTTFIEVPNFDHFNFITAFHDPNFEYSKVWDRCNSCVVIGRLTVEYVIFQVFCA